MLDTKKTKLLLEQYQNYPKDEQRQMLRFALILSDQEFFKTQYDAAMGIDVTERSTIDPAEYQAGLDQLLTAFYRDDENQLRLLTPAVDTYFQGGTIPLMEDDQLDAFLAQMEQNAEQRQKVDTWAPLLADAIAIELEMHAQQAARGAETAFGNKSAPKEMNEQIKKLFPELTAEIRTILKDKGFPVENAEKNVRPESRSRERPIRPPTKKRPQ